MKGEGKSFFGMKEKTRGRERERGGEGEGKGEGERVWEEQRAAARDPLGKVSNPVKRVSVNQSCVLLPSTFLLLPCCASGYDGPVVGLRNYTEPQIAIINTDEWTWTTTFSSNPEDPLDFLSLPVAAIIAIVVGICLVFMGLGFLAGRFFWTRHTAQLEKKQRNDTHSPLTKNRKCKTGGNSSTNQLVPKRSRFASLTDQESHFSGDTALGTQAFGSNSSKAQPIIVTRYAPTGSSSTTAVSCSKPVHDSVKPSPYDLPNSERLPKTMADMQYGHYVRTLQHSRHYDQQRTRHNRPEAVYSHHEEMGASDDDPYLVTGMLDLKEVEVGEEPGMILMGSMESGPMLVSEITEIDGLDSTANKGQSRLFKFGRALQTKMGLGGQDGNDKNDVKNKYNHVPGPGVPFAGDKGEG